MSEPPDEPEPKPPAPARTVWPGMVLMASRGTDIIVAWVLFGAACDNRTNTALATVAVARAVLGLMETALRVFQDRG